MAQDALSQGLSIDLNPTPYYLSKPEANAQPPINIPPLKTSADVYAANQRLAPSVAEAESKVQRAQLGMEETVAAQRAAAAEKISGEARSTADAYRKRLAEFPYPEFHPTQDNVQSLGGLFSLISTLGLMLGAGGKMSSMGALKSMTGMMNGWRQGRADLFKQEGDNFQKEFAKMKAIHEDIKSDFDEYMKLLPTDKEAAMYKAEEIARKTGSNSIIAANLERGRLKVVQENIDAAGKLIAKHEEEVEKRADRHQQELDRQAFQLQLERDRKAFQVELEKNKFGEKLGTAGPRFELFQKTGKVLPTDKEAIQVQSTASALRLVDNLRERLKDPDIETGLKALPTSFFQKLKSITSEEEFGQAVNDLDANDKTLLFIKDSAILGLTIEQSLTGSRVPVFTQRMMGPIFSVQNYRKSTYDQLLKSRQEQLYNVAEDYGFSRDELNKYARIGETKPPKTDTPKTDALSKEQQEALDWANKNPNDPRAAKIKQRLKVQ